MRAIPFTPDASDDWDALVEHAPMATFLHTRRFLSYHGDRFRDASLLLAENGVVRAVLPAALDPDHAGRVVSHPGATYGGLVHDGRLYPEGIRDALEAARSHYGASGLAALEYKPVPHIYHRSPSADDVWVLNALGARRVGCALSCAVDLSARRAPTARRRRALGKAARSGVDVRTDTPFPDFWPVLSSRLERRYSTRPVHTLAEIELLHGRFPEAIRLVTGVLDGETVAGMVLFQTGRVFHVQYMAAGDAGRRIGALDAVVERGIELAVADGAHYFDFGTSMLDRGDDLQSGLHRFKAEFGGGGVIHEEYELALGRDAA